MSTVIYGPVPSWRLGSSLGIDLVSTDTKTCSVNCTYCQLGETVQQVSERNEFVSLDRIEDEIEAVKGIEIDYVTFSGMGEPTLASNFGQAVELVRSALDFPIAVLTNSSLLFLPDVQKELAHVDFVVAKLDASDEKMFQAINRPASGISLDQTIDGIRRFRRSFSGRLALQIMFIDSNKEQAAEMASLAVEIAPDEVQLNTPLRPCPERPLSREEIEDVKPVFANFGGIITSVYDSMKPSVVPISTDETLRRRPVL